MNSDKIKELSGLFSSISTSFYYSSKFLPENIKPINSILYLMARIADTIEDCNLTIPEKSKYFDIYKEIINFQGINNKLMPDFLEMSNKKHANLTIPETNLIIATPLVMGELQNFNKKTRDTLIDNITEMSEGMEKFLEHRINTFEDQDEYSYYVATTVGDAITESYSFNEHNVGDTLSLIKSFSLALQKVNMIRGIREDYNKKEKNEANRIYVPQNLLDNQKISLEGLFYEDNKDKALIILDELVEDALINFKDGIEYLKKIPSYEKEIRKFSSAIFFASLKMLNKCNGNYKIFSEDKEIGLNKGEAFTTLWKSLKYSSDNLKITDYYNSLKKF